MTNYELLCWLVKTQSRDIRHYQMTNMLEQPYIIANKYLKKNQNKSPK